MDERVSEDQERQGGDERPVELYHRRRFVARGTLAIEETPDRQTPWRGTLQIISDLQSTDAGGRLASSRELYVKLDDDSRIPAQLTAQDRLKWHVVGLEPLPHNRDSEPNG